ncbi:hypothetical protein [Enterococcus ureasiticus]|uniref:Uncharacterized protein n=1 Tax=Enterococcus ureasiticus TaxID=903984 RepID=A0A1E5GMZ1_9ENTE|nr:hypothetical protein [Enterococcus ureasiticus]OEG14066.1 hypothetical protein BCR21_03480 [Enterococcus ureasiticus]
MKKRKISLGFVVLVAMCLGFVLNGYETEAAEINMNRGTTFVMDPSGSSKKIYSGVYETINSSKGLYRYDSYTGEAQFAYANASTKNIQAAYIVNERMFNFEGTYSPKESYFNGKSKIWVYNIQKVNGLTPVYKTSVKILEGLPGGTVLSIRADQGLVPNWVGLPNIDSMSKVLIESASISVKVQ